MLPVMILLFAFTSLKPANQARVVTFEQFEQATQHKDNDTLYVANFWATWCVPCVAEMPYFTATEQKLKGQKVKFVFVSLNAKRELDKVNTFINNKGIQSDMLLLDAGNPNDWIDKVDSTWSGSIPVTVMYLKGEKVFFREGEFTQEGLESIIKTKIKQL